MADKSASDFSELTVEEKLKALYGLQKIDSQIDKLNLLRGELPFEVQDLEDEIAGLEIRIAKYEADLVEFDTAITGKGKEKLVSKDLIAKYEEQRNNVRNNREYDSLSKEIEFQGLEMELSDKRIREFTAKKDDKQKEIVELKSNLEGRLIDLENKKKELNDITDENSKEEVILAEKSAEFEKLIEPRLLTAYKRIRGGARNGLAVVSVNRDACGGCFNNIPPQRQLELKSWKKVIVCEYCGRILVDDSEEVIEE